MRRLGALRLWLCQRDCGLFQYRLRVKRTARSISSTHRPIHTPDTFQNAGDPDRSRRLDHHGSIHTRILACSHMLHWWFKRLDHGYIVVDWTQGDCLKFFYWLTMRTSMVERDFWISNTRVRCIPHEKMFPYWMVCWMTAVIFHWASNTSFFLCLRFEIWVAKRNDAVQ